MHNIDHLEDLIDNKDKIKIKNKVKTSLTDEVAELRESSVKLPEETIEEMKIRIKNMGF